MTIRFSPLLLLACLAFGLSYGPATADEAIALPDLEGKVVRPLDAGDKKAAVIFFISPYCPTSNNFAPEMNSIVQEFRSEFRFFFVHSDTSVTEADRKQHAELMEISEPVLNDAEQILAKKLGAKTTPEVVVIAQNGETLYQGRINDLYLSPTKRQREVTSHDLRDALTAIKEGNAVATPKTEAMGCKIVIAP